MTVPTPTTNALFRAVDRGAFVVALGERLRRAGVPVTFTAFTALTDALALEPPRDVRSLYWLGRVTLVTQPQDLPTYDGVFDVVFRESQLPVAGQARGPAGDVHPPTGLPRTDPRAEDDPGDSPAGGLPWYTLPRSDDGPGDDEGRPLPDLLPSAVAAVADVAFDDLDPAQLAAVGAWLERSLVRWPTRLGRRRRVHPAGRQIALRATIAASRQTGWEPLRLARSRPVRRPRPVTMLVDLSQSMQSYSSAYLHVMRALARSGRAETFAFSTSLSRITPALMHRSAQVAIDLATEQVTDRYGGTRLASNLAALLASRHGSSLRGGVLVVASDGWDADEPERLAHAMRRARLRAHTVVWLNPRLAAPGYEPLVGSMRAALPYCDTFLPAHSLREVLRALDAIMVPGPDRRAS